MITHVSVTGSTNDDARDLKYSHGDVVWADFQTAGRGQKGHTWLSAQGMNLTFSVVLDTSFVPIPDQFNLNVAISLALKAFFAHNGIDSQIKWTNDIYVKGKKICGILIEHTLAASTLKRTILGVGINVNQREFDASIPNPTSMTLELGGKNLDRAALLEDFVKILLEYIDALREDGVGVMFDEYLDSMYRLGTQATYQLPDGTRFQGTLRGVRPTGELIVENTDGTSKEYLFKEIEFVI